MEMFGRKIYDCGLAEAVKFATPVQLHPQGAFDRVFSPALVTGLLAHAKTSVAPLHMVVRPIHILPAQEGNHLGKLLPGKPLEYSTQEAILLVCFVPHHSRSSAPGLVFALVLPEEAMELQAELPVSLQFRCDLVESLEVLSVLFCETIFAFYDQMLVFPDELGLFFSLHLWLCLAVLPAFLCFFRRSASTAFASGLSGPVQTVLCRTHRIQNGLVGLFEYVKYAQLMFYILPLFGQGLLVQRRTIGHRHLRFDPCFGKLCQNGLESDGIGSVGDMEIDGQVVQRVGYEEDGLAGIVDLVDAADAGKILLGPLEILLLIHLIVGPPQAAVDKSDGDFQVEIFFHSLLGFLSRQIVANQRSNDGIPDGIAVLACLGQKLRRGTKRLATTATCLIYPQRQLDQGGSAIGDVPNESDGLLTSPAVFATFGAGPIFGTARFFLDDFDFPVDKYCIHACDPPCLRVLLISIFPLNRQIQAFPLTPSTYNDDISIEQCQYISYFS